MVSHHRYFYFGQAVGAEKANLFDAPTASVAGSEVIVAHDGAS